MNQNNGSVPQEIVHLIYTEILRGRWPLDTPAPRVPPTFEEVERLVPTLYGGQADTRCLTPPMLFGGGQEVAVHRPLPLYPNHLRPWNSGYFPHQQYGAHDVPYPLALPNHPMAPLVHFDRHGFVCAPIQPQFSMANHWTIQFGQNFSIPSNGPNWTFSQQTAPVTNAGALKVPKVPKRRAPKKINASQSRTGQDTAGPSSSPAVAVSDDQSLSELVGIVGQLLKPTKLPRKSRKGALLCYEDTPTQEVSEGDVMSSNERLSQMCEVALARQERGNQETDDSPSESLQDGIASSVPASTRRHFEPSSTSEQIELKLDLSRTTVVETTKIIKEEVLEKLYLTVREITSEPSEEANGVVLENAEDVVEIANSTIETEEGEVDEDEEIDILVDWNPSDELIEVREGSEELLQVANVPIEAVDGLCGAVSVRPHSAPAALYSLGSAEVGEVDSVKEREQERAEGQEGEDYEEEGQEEAAEEEEMVEDEIDVLGEWDSEAWLVEARELQSKEIVGEETEGATELGSGDLIQEEANDEEGGQMEENPASSRRNSDVILRDDQGYFYEPHDGQRSESPEERPALERFLFRRRVESPAPSPQPSPGPSNSTWTVVEEGPRTMLLRRSGQRSPPEEPRQEEDSRREERMRKRPKFFSPEPEKTKKRRRK